MDWIWKKPWGWENSYIGNAEGTEVVLNGHFSTGMSFVTSSSTLSERDHHYWEVQLLYGCFGTATV